MLSCSRSRLAVSEVARSSMREIRGQMLGSTIIYPSCCARTTPTRRKRNETPESNEERENQELGTRHP